MLSSFIKDSETVCSQQSTGVKERKGNSPRTTVHRPNYLILFSFSGQHFKVVPNIRRADVREDMGLVILELEGEEEEIDRSIQWVGSQGVRVDPVSGDIIEG